MRCCILLLLTLLACAGVQAQWKEYSLTEKGDTLNRIDQQGRKQGPWTHHYDNVRGEPGYEEEGWYTNDKKTGEWKLFSLMGDLVGIENYKWGMKDGACQYFTIHGQLRLEQNWKAFNPDKPYDTLEIEDPDKLNSYKTVIVQNVGAAVKHGVWKYYDAETGTLIRTETYTLGKLEVPEKSTAVAPDKKPAAKPQAIQDFEKKNTGKKKVRYRDGSTGGGN